MTLPVSREPQTVPELLRIMDVATALRREREMAQKELAIDETKVKLRERLRAAAIESGDPVTEVEIEAAIGQYFATQHEFSEPRGTWKVFIAHAWVRRTTIAVATCAALAVTAFSWWAFFSSSAPMSSTTRAKHQLESASASLETALGRARAIAANDAARAAVDVLAREVEGARSLGDVPAMNQLATRTDALTRVLEESYELHVISRPNENSGVDAYYDDAAGKRLSGYYLVVEARSGDRVLERKVRDAELQRESTVRKWGEQVPKEVYDRVGGDRRADGIVDETLFATKRRGELDEVVVMTGADGRTPLPRGRKITTKL